MPEPCTRFPFLVGIGSMGDSGRPYNCMDGKDTLIKLLFCRTKLYGEAERCDILTDMHSTYTNLSALVVNVISVHKLLMQLPCPIDGRRAPAWCIAKFWIVWKICASICWIILNLNSQVLCQLLLLTLPVVLLHVLYSAYAIPWLHVVLCCLCAVAGGLCAWAALAVLS